jgi:hypothetical protein
MRMSFWYLDPGVGDRHSAHHLCCRQVRDDHLHISRHHLHAIPDLNARTGPHHSTAAAIRSLTRGLSLAGVVSAGLLALAGLKARLPSADAVPGSTNVPRMFIAGSLPTCVTCECAVSSSSHDLCGRGHVPPASDLNGRLSLVQSNQLCAEAWRGLCGRALMGGGCVKVDARATLLVFPSGYLICARRCG